jgi:hypothetical protein
METFAMLCFAGGFCVGVGASMLVALVLLKMFILPHPN